MIAKATLIAAAHHVQQSSTANSVPKGLLGAAIMIAALIAVITVTKALVRASRR